MAKKDKKKKDDDGPAVTNVDWMNDDFGPMTFDEEEEKEEEEVKPKKGKGKAKGGDDAAGGGKKLQQQQGKGKKGKQKDEQPATSGWGDVHARSADWTNEPATTWDTTNAYSSGMGGGYTAPAAAQTAWEAPAAYAQEDWTQPGASTSQTPYASQAHLQYAAPQTGGWGNWANSASATPAAMPYAPGGNPIWYPPHDDEDEEDDYDAIAAVNMAAQQAANNKKQAKGKNNQQKSKMQRQQEAAQDWTVPQAEPQPSQAYDWSTGNEKKKKGKQKEGNMETLYATGYMPNYAPAAQSYPNYTPAPAPAPPSLYSHAFAVASSETHGIAPAWQALLGRHRLSSQRIHWIFSPTHDQFVRDTMVFIQDPQVKQELAEIGLQHFLMTREPGCFFVNAAYRLPDRPHTPAFDWLRYQEVQETYDRTIQRSLMYYDPADFVIVFVFLVSRTGNSMACWRRRIPIPPQTKAPYRSEIAKIKAEMKTREYRILVDTPEEMEASAGFSPMRAASWAAPTPGRWPTGMPPTPVPPPPQDKPKGGWFKVFR